MKSLTACDLRVGLDPLLHTL